VRRCARQGDEPALVEDELRELLGHNVMPLLRLLYAQAAASCSALSRALSCSCPKRQARSRPLEPRSAAAAAPLAVVQHFPPAPSACSGTVLPDMRASDATCACTRGDLVPIAYVVKRACRATAHGHAPLLPSTRCMRAPRSGGC